MFEAKKHVGVIDSSQVGVDNPVVQGFYEMIFTVAGGIQPTQPEAFTAAMRVTEMIQRGVAPDKINMNDLGLIFRAAGLLFDRFIVEAASK